MEDSSHGFKLSSRVESRMSQPNEDLHLGENLSITSTFMPRKKSKSSRRLEENGGKLEQTVMVLSFH